MHPCLQVEGELERSSFTAKKVRVSCDVYCGRRRRLASNLPIEIEICANIFHLVSNCDGGDFGNEAHTASALSDASSLVVYLRVFT